MQDKRKWNEGRMKKEKKGKKIRIKEERIKVITAKK